MKDRFFSVVEVDVVVYTKIPNLYDFFNLYIIIIKYIFYKNYDYYVTSEINIISSY